MTLNYTPEQFEQYKANYKRLALIKTDNNGTQYYEGVCTCPRCNGVGIVYKGVHNGELVPHTPDSGVCYRCGGAKVIPATIKVFTKEHAEQLEKRREAKLQKELKAKEQAKVDTVTANKKLGYKEVDFEVDEWVHFNDLSLYKYYRIARQTERAYLLHLVGTLEVADKWAHEEWIPIRAIHFSKEETK